MTTDAASSPPGEVNLMLFFQVLTRRWLLILACTFLGGVVGVGVALSLPNYYSASATLLINPNGESQGRMAGLLGNMQGVASLLSLGGQGPTTKKDEYLAYLRSRQFVEKFVVKHGIKVPLFAERSRFMSGERYYDSDVYDTGSKTWAPPGEPSGEDAYKAFTKTLRVEDDPRTGLLQISVSWRDPEQCKQWLMWFIADINEYIRTIEADQARQSIQFVNNELRTQTLAESRSALINLLSIQENTLMMAGARRDYAFVVIDPPFVPEKKTWPPRSLIAAGSAFAGLLAALAYILITQFILVRSRRR